MTTSPQLSPRPRAVVFDAVGTLLLADPPVAQAYREIGSRYGAELSATTIASRFADALASRRGAAGETNEAHQREFWQAVVRDVFRELPAAGGALFEELWRHFAQASAWRLYDDVPSSLAALQQQGFQLAIASNFDQRLPGVCSGHPPLAGLPLLPATELGYLKPDVRFFRGVEERLQLPPAEILLVGDDLLEDAQGAGRAGWQAVLLDRNARHAQPGRHSFPVIHDLRQLTELLSA